MLFTRRKTLGFSQDEFAEQAGMERTYVSMLECGIHAPSLRAIVLISAVFRMRPEEFVAEVEKARADGMKLPEPVPRGKTRKHSPDTSPESHEILK